MIRLDLSREPRWLDLGHGVRLHAAHVSYRAVACKIFSFNANHPDYGSG